MAPWNLPKNSKPKPKNLSLYGIGGKNTEGASIGLPKTSGFVKIPWASLLEDYWSRHGGKRSDGTASLSPTHVASGLFHSLVGFSDGTVLSMGIGSMGQLGLGKGEEEFGQVIGLPNGSKIKNLGAGRAHSVFVVETANGDEVYSCGLASLGQLGLGLSRDSYPGKTIIVHTPTRIFSIGRSNPTEQNPLSSIASLQCGLDHTVILTTEGEVYTTGWGSDGQLGLGPNFTSDVSIPTLVSGLPSKFVGQISCSTDHTLAKLYDGRIYVWGNGENGQLMMSEKLDKLAEPVPTGAFGKLQGRVKGRGQAKDVAAGGTVSLVMTEKEVWATGTGPCLGLGSSCVETLTPKKLPLTNVQKIYAGTSSCAAVTDQGQLLFWGFDLQTNEPIWEPRLIETSGKVHDVAIGGDGLLCLVEE